MIFAQPLTVVQIPPLAVELGIGDDGEIVFQTYTVGEPTQGAGRAPEILVFPGAVQRGGVVINVIMNVRPVGVGGNEKGVFPLRPAHGRLIAYAVCLLRRNLSRLEGLPDLITQHVGVPALLPARDGFVSGLGKQKLRISGLRVALIGRDQFPVSGFLRALSIVETVFQRLRYGFAPADMVGFEKCGRRKITSSTAKGKAAAAALGHFVPKLSVCNKAFERFVQPVQLSNEPVRQRGQAVGGHEERAHKSDDGG